MNPIYFHIYHFSCFFSVRCRHSCYITELASYRVFGREGVLAVLTADLGLLLPARERLDLLAACTLSGEGKSSARMCSPQGDHSRFSCSCQVKLVGCLLQESV